MAFEAPRDFSSPGTVQGIWCATLWSPRLLEDDSGRTMPQRVADVPQVRVIATACSATFLTINGAQLYSPYVGDAEATLREVFRQARLASPSVLFLDEVSHIPLTVTDRSAGGCLGWKARRVGRRSRKLTSSSLIYAAE